MTNAVAVARSVLDAYWDRTVPVDLDKIAEAMGVKVVYSRGIDGDWDVSGKLCIEKGVPTCYVNKFDTPQRQRFTLAHELGHYKLGHGEQTDSTESLYRNTNGYQSSLEREANAFAAELSMPEVAIDYYIQKKGVTSLSDLAEMFCSSPIAMRYRLRNLGWL